MTQLWQYWRMCADVSGVRFDEADELRVSVLIRNGQGTAGISNNKGRIPAYVISCMSGSVRAINFGVSDCEIDIQWAPAPMPGCEHREQGQ